jgi:hypothetical protein
MAVLCTVELTEDGQCKATTPAYPELFSLAPGPTQAVAGLVKLIREMGKAPLVVCKEGTW